MSAPRINVENRGTHDSLLQPRSDLLGKIHMPAMVANLTFRGLMHNRLYFCGSTSLYARCVDTQVAMRP